MLLQSFHEPIESVCRKLKIISQNGSWVMTCDKKKYQCQCVIAHYDAHISGMRDLLSPKHSVLTTRPCTRCIGENGSLILLLSLCGVIMTQRLLSELFGNIAAAVLAGIKPIILPYTMVLQYCVNFP